MVLRISQSGQREDGKFVGPNPGEAALQLQDLDSLGTALKELLTAVQFAAITQTQNPRAQVYALKLRRPAAGRHLL